jgi:hypothetical protein
MSLHAEVKFQNTRDAFMRFVTYPPVLTVNPSSHFLTILSRHHAKLPETQMLPERDPDVLRALSSLVPQECAKKMGTLHSAPASVGDQGTQRL